MAPMAERPQLRETTATGTGAQVTQAEPHLPRPLQPFTVPVGWRISAEPGPPRRTLNFAGPAPRRSRGCSPGLWPRRTGVLSFTNISHRQARRSPLAQGAGCQVPRVSRTREEPKSAQPPRAEPALLRRPSFPRYCPQGPARPRRLLPADAPQPRRGVEAGASWSEDAGEVGARPGRARLALGLGPQLGRVGAVGSEHRGRAAAKPGGLVGAPFRCRLKMLSLPKPPPPA